MVSLMSSRKSAMMWRWHHPPAHNSSSSLSTPSTKKRRPKCSFALLLLLAESLRCDSARACEEAILQVLNLGSNERSGPFPSSLGVRRALQLVLLNGHYYHPLFQVPFHISW
ncbi:unnamed protein product [Ectocarpus sp. 13 AM-2016]